MPLTVTRRPHRYRGAAAVVDLEPGPLLPVVTRAYPDVGGDADAEPHRLTGGAPAPLLGA